MNITPLEIRQKTFEKEFRGFDKDEVAAFLKSLSQQWEKIIDENKELKIKLEASEKEVEKLREVESSLFKTLKTAEDTGANMIDQANKAAELHLRETQMKADTIMSDSKLEAKNMVERARKQARASLENMENEIKELVKVYKSIESLRDNLVDDIKHTAGSILERIKRSQEKLAQVDIDDLMNKYTTEAADRIRKADAETLKSVSDLEEKLTEQDTAEKIKEPVKQSPEDAKPAEEEKQVIDKIYTGPPEDERPDVPIESLPEPEDDLEMPEAVEDEPVEESKTNQPEPQNPSENAEEIEQKVESEGPVESDEPTPVTVSVPKEEEPVDKAITKDQPEAVPEADTESEELESSGQTAGEETESAEETKRISSKDKSFFDDI